MRAPVSLSVEFVLSVMLTLSKVVSAACILLTTPSPPKTCKAPVVVEEASVTFSILPVPPTNRFSPIPTPPVTWRAPVVFEVAAASPLMRTLESVEIFEVTWALPVTYSFESGTLSFSPSPIPIPRPPSTM